MNKFIPASQAVISKQLRNQNRSFLPERIAPYPIDGAVGIKRFKRESGPRILFLIMYSYLDGIQRLIPETTEAVVDRRPFAARRHTAVTLQALHHAGQFAVRIGVSPASACLVLRE
ncbi:Uncharacterised protein [Mycobacterium tuberculosis]|nr:Uncharacterised protein [Mycobacterium tuberculosis]